MANVIRFNKTEMDGVVSTLRRQANTLKTAGSTFISDMNTAIQDWEGQSKDKFAGCVQSINSYVTKDLPGLVTALADMLESNYTQMNTADKNIAGQIPDSLVK